MMSKVTSMIKGKCPHCHQGDVFTHKQFYHPTKFSEMNEACDHCHTSFFPEPGFYTGAMYVSYALAIPIAFLVAMGLSYGFGVSDEVALGAMIMSIFLMTPINFRLSRLIWLYLLGKTKTAKSNKYISKEPL
ncbi:hypothetical protein BKI52_29850 [marine bacterium AO1-C]|nr:hypothetical protein BKI52_29850 [marine bacterium AO1-C]